MPLCLVNGAFKPFKGPFHGNRLQGGEGGWGGLRRLQGDRWSEVRSSSIAQSPRRGGGGAAGVLTSRNDLRRVAMGILLSERGSSRVSLFCFRICVAVCFLCLSNPRNLPTSNHFPTIFTQQQINGEHENFLLLPFEQKKQRNTKINTLFWHVS